MTISLPPPRPRIHIDVSLAIVNIVLLLIFFFLVTGQTQPIELGKVELSQTSELPLDKLPKPLLLVSTEGDWLLDGQPISPDLLGVALDALPQPVTLNILMNRDAPAEMLVDVLNRPELAGRDLRVVTLRFRDGGT
ncbi:ExbD/TolR family protein [Paracoccus pacificus]|uniref:ExbD/TolR family protein n=1 Tax=Paracoccus pacificus TaxID=1463598 RepID=A0ABW4R7D9_9RHOB